MNWIVRAGVAAPDMLVAGYTEHRAVPGLYGFSVQYAPNKTIGELAQAGQFPNAQISYATGEALAAALASLGYRMHLVSSPGQGYHHTFVVLYDTSGVALQHLPIDAARAISQTFQRQPNPFRSAP